MAKDNNPAIIALKALIKHRDLTYDDLRPEIGSKSYVSLILSGERNLTRAHIQKLTARYGIPETVFF